MRSEESAELLGQKVSVVEEEMTLLREKANEAELEKQRLQIAAMKVCLAFISMIQILIF